MVVLRIMLGFIASSALGFGFHYAILSALGAGQPIVLVIAGIMGVLAGAYGALAFGRNVYQVGFFSIVAYILDVTWSMLNTIAGFLIWIPACMVAGSFVAPTPHSRRSGTFVYTNNPRGGGYDATTIGTVIGGGWSSHEEVHTWQARVFGPIYMPMYLISLLLALFARLVTGKVQSIVQEAYYRVCFEDWAYAGGSGSKDDDTIHWLSWVVWFLLTSLYVAFGVLLVAGIATGTLGIALVGLAGLIGYSLIRNFISAPAQSL